MNYLNINSIVWHTHTANKQIIKLTTKNFWNKFQVSLTQYPWETAAQASEHINCYQITIKNQFIRECV